MNSSRGHHKKKKTLETVYHEIIRNYIRLKKRDKKHNNNLLKSVLQKLLNIMRDKDPLFKSMKPKLGFLGSYFDRLRVGQPTEYDINIILSICINYDKVQLDSLNCKNFQQTVIKMPSEFRRLSCSSSSAEIGYDETILWCDKEFRLSVTKFHSWMQSVIDRALSSLPKCQSGKKVLCAGNKFYEIETKLSGPAITLKIQIERKSIDVDLVPTFSFKLPKRPDNSRIDFSKVESSNLKEYFVVPKPSENEYEWRLALPDQEKHFLKDKNNLKTVLKLIKLLRDVQGFKSLASYYLKSLFLKEIELQNAELAEQAGGKESYKNKCFWKNNSVSYLVLHMLKRLRDNLRKGEIKSFWCSDLNLIESKIKRETCINWSNRLCNIIKDIEENGKSNPDVIRKYFLRIGRIQKN